MNNFFSSQKCALRYSNTNTFAGMFSGSEIHCTDYVDHTQKILGLSQIKPYLILAAALKYTLLSMQVKHPTAAELVTVYKQNYVYIWLECVFWILVVVMCASVLQ